MPTASEVANAVKLLRSEVSPYAEVFLAKLTSLGDSQTSLATPTSLLQCGYTTENVDEAHPSHMEQYYPLEEQKKYGVVGIEFFPPK